MPEDITEDFLINSFTDLQDEIDDTVKKFKQMLKETNQHTDPVEPSQIQQRGSKTAKNRGSVKMHFIGGVLSKIQI